MLDLQHIPASTAANGGCTYNVVYGDLAGTASYAVALFPERSVVLDHSLTFRDLLDFVLDNADLLARPDVSLGTWEHEGQTWLDVVGTIEDRGRAERLGRALDQIAIFDLGNLEEIPTGGTGKAFPADMPLEERLELLVTA